MQRFVVWQFSLSRASLCRSAEGTPSRGHNIQLEKEGGQSAQGPWKMPCCEKGDRMEEEYTYAEQVKNGSLSKAEKTFLMQELAADFSRMEGKKSEGKVVMQASIELSLGKDIAGLHRAMSYGTYLYFMGKPPIEEEFC